MSPSLTYRLSEESPSELWRQFGPIKGGTETDAVDLSHAKTMLKVKEGIIADIRDGYILPAIQYQFPMLAAVLREAMGLAETLKVDQDFVFKEGRAVLTLRYRKENFDGLYPNLKPTTARGAALLRYAIEATHGLVEGEDFTFRDKDVVFSGRDDATAERLRPFVEWRIGKAPVPRPEAIARTNLQRMFERCDTLSGTGLGLFAARRELRQTYALRRPKQVRTPRPKVWYRATADLAKDAADVAKGAAVITTSDPAAGAALKQTGTPAQILLPGELPRVDSGDEALILAAAPDQTRWEARVTEHFARREAKVLRLVDISMAPRLLRLVPPRVIHDVRAYLADRQARRLRRTLRDYDRKVHDMLSFAGDAE